MTAAVAPVEAVSAPEAVEKVCTGCGHPSHAESCEAVIGEYAPFGYALKKHCWCEEDWDALRELEPQEQEPEDRDSWEANHWREIQEDRMDRVAEDAVFES